jgi:hypothetical protein
MARKAKFTQTVTGPKDVFVTPGRLATAVAAFDEGITSGGQQIPKKGYGDMEVPGERDINIKRSMGASDGPGKLQNYTQRKK